jgi:hypothetical protein
MRAYTAGENFKPNEVYARIKDKYKCCVECKQINWIIVYKTRLSQYTMELK